MEGQFKEASISDTHLSTIGVFKQILMLAVPMIISSVLTTFAEQINLFFVGNLNDVTSLAAVGLGNMFINIFAFSPIYGMNTALETLVSQAYGAYNLPLCGVYLRQGQIMLTVMFIPVAIVVLLSENILLALGQDPEVCAITSQYVIRLLPGIFMMALFDAQKNFLNSMTRSTVPTLIQIMALPFHLFFAYIFVRKLDYGPFGACYALNITYTILFFGILAYSRLLSDLKEAREFPQLSTITSGLWTYFKLGGPGCIMMAVGWLATEITALLAGLIGKEEQAAMVLLTNFEDFIWKAAFGLSLAAAVIVGNLLGANESKEAKRRSKFILGIGFALLGTICIIVYQQRYQVAAIYTKVDSVINLFAGTMSSMLCMCFIDGMQNILAGIIKGLGIQGQASIGTVITSMFISIPLSVLFAFYFNMSLPGLWYGLSVGLIILICIFVWMLVKADWD